MESLLIVSLCLLVSFAGNVFLIWWGFQKHLTAEKDQRVAASRGVSLKEFLVNLVLRIERIGRRSGAQKKAYAMSALKRRFPGLSEKEASDLIEAAITTLMKGK